jgi:hypothetical protein
VLDQFNCGIPLPSGDPPLVAELAILYKNCVIALEIHIQSSLPIPHVLSLFACLWYLA